MDDDGHQLLTDNQFCTCVKFASKIAAVSYQMCKNLGHLPQINPETYSSGLGISLVHKI